MYVHKYLFSMKRKLFKIFDEIWALDDVKQISFKFFL